MAPKNLRSTVDVAKDLTTLKRDSFEVAVSVTLLAEMLRAGYGASAPAEAMQGCAVALAEALIDKEPVATLYKHAFDPVYDVVMHQARGEHLLDAATT